MVEQKRRIKVHFSSGAGGQHLYHCCFGFDILGYHGDLKQSNFGKFFNLHPFYILNLVCKK